VTEFEHCHNQPKKILYILRGELQSIDEHIDEVVDLSNSRWSKVAALHMKYSRQIVFYFAGFWEIAHLPAHCKGSAVLVVVFPKSL